MAKTNSLWGWQTTSRMHRQGVRKTSRPSRSSASDTEHNNKTNVMPEFERSVKERHQVVARTMHHFTVKVKEAGSSKNAVQGQGMGGVKNSKQLQSFEPVGDATVT